MSPGRAFSSSKRLPGTGTARLIPSAPSSYEYHPGRKLTDIDAPLPLVLIEMGGKVSENPGKPVKRLENGKDYAASIGPGRSPFSSTISSREFRISYITPGRASPARRSKASRTEDFPVLFRPVIKLTRPRPSISTFRRDRKFSIARLEILGSMLEILYDIIGP
jgi:hypothetical protein